MKNGQIITFYSYKGGVGRSMALANVAALLAQRGKRVLAIDFDLEAPGLHRYFLSRSTKLGDRRYEPTSEQRGVIDLFVELKHRLEHAFPGAGDYNSEDEQARGKVEEIVAACVGRPDYGYTITLSNPAAPTVDSTLTFLSAGSFKDDYAERVRRFDWQTFYEEFAEVFTDLRKIWRERYDYVLVDARTGLTDTGSVCTVVLPDKLVVAFSPNEQSLEGALEITRQSVHMRAEASPGDRLPVFPLMSRIELGEEELKLSWLRRAARDFARLFTELYGWSDCDLTTYFDFIEIAHSGYYAYGEKIAVEERSPRSFGSLAEGYARFLDCLQHASVAEWQAAGGGVIAPTSTDRALVISFDAPFQPPPTMAFERVVTIPEEPLEVTSAALRSAPLNGPAWERVLGEIDRGIERVRQGPRGSLHVFTMAPYPVAVLLGRRLDALARAYPLYTYQWDASAGDWRPFSMPSAYVPLPESKPFFRDLEVVSWGFGDGVLLVIEGTTQTRTETLLRLGEQVGAGTLARLRPRSQAPLQSVAEARGAMSEVRRAIEYVHGEHPTAAFHVVSSAPVALLIEVGRVLSPTVYRQAIIYQYVPETGGYLPVVDVISLRLVPTPER